MKRAKTSAGFSLVEVALALLVVAIGLLSAFALFPTGLDLNKRAIDDAQTAMFADEVVNGFLATATTSRWADVDNIVIEPPAPDMWKNLGAMRIQANKGWKVAKYESTYNAVVDHALNYNLVVKDVASSGNQRKYLRLEVLNGEFKGSNTNNLSSFYVELFNRGN